MNNLFAVYDSCSATFADPFVAANEAVAKRLFDNTIGQPSVPKYIRDDSVLYCIGRYDNKTGYVSYDSAPYVVSRGSSIVLPHDTLSEAEVTKIEE